MFGDPALFITGKNEAGDFQNDPCPLVVFHILALNTKEVGMSNWSPVRLKG